MSDTTRILKYMEVYDALRNDILMKVYPNNTLLPTESQLMELYHVSRNTIRKALKQLQEENFITTQRGSGSLVCYDSLSESFRTGLVNWTSTKTEVEYYVPIEKIQISHPVLDSITAPPEVASAMGLEPGSRVFRSQSIWVINGTPYNYMLQYINPLILPEYDQLCRSRDNVSVTGLLEKHYGYHRLRATEHILCCNAGFVEANLLNVEPGTALEYTYRLAECEKGLFEYAIFYGNPAYTGYRVIIEGPTDPSHPASIGDLHENEDLHEKINLHDR